MLQQDGAFAFWAKNVKNNIYYNYNYKYKYNYKYNYKYEFNTIRDPNTRR